MDGNQDQIERQLPRLVLPKNMAMLLQEVDGLLLPSRNNPHLSARAGK